MPNIDVNLLIDAPIDEIWETVHDVASYPSYMSNVVAVEVESESDDGDRLSRWSVLLKGSVLEWTEREQIDEQARRITFDQVDGDLDLFSGYWQLTEAPDGFVEVTLTVEFEIGIPLLADMLNPVAARALSDNSEQMLREIERRVAAG